MTSAALRTLQERPLLEALLDREFSEERLSATLDLESPLPEQLWDRALSGPLRAMACRPGKEFRRQLVAIGWQLSGARGEPPPELPGIVEALHLGSLIVDDIEDGSASRRGGPSLHLLVGTPLALNAGNWLYFLPGLLVSRLELPRTRELPLRRAIERSVLRCHYGQALDLSTRVTELRQRDVANVVATTTRLKTGSLTELAATLGGLAAGAAPEVVGALATMGRDFGVALQMLDDLTGLTSIERCHKGHEDLLAARPTWPWAFLAEHVDEVAYQRLRSLAEEVVSRDLHPETPAEPLREQVASIGFSAIRTHLRRTRDKLSEAIGEPEGFAALAAEMERLERFDG
jgi:geranylgeranyl pyrophosphate synthase